MNERLEEFLTYLQVECGASRNTILAYRSDLTPFEGPLTREGVERFTTSLARRFRRASSTARSTAAFRSFLRFIGRRDLLPFVIAPKKPHLLPHPVGQKQLERMVECDGEDRFPARNRAVVEVLYAAGLRASELASLRLADVNLDAGYIRCIGKGNKERVVPIGKPAIEAVRVYMSTERKNDPSEFLFVSRKGTPLSRESVWRVIQLRAVNAEVHDRVFPHALRHSFATHLVQNGADIRYVQEMLGHSKISTTQIYTQVDRERLCAVHRRFHPRG